jgi:transcriptional regulator with XRE-family HTH domain
MTTQPITDIPALLKWADTKRHHDGLTYADLAGRLGVSTSTVSKWLTGKREIPSKKLLALIAIMDSALILVRKTEPNSNGRPT